MPGGDGTVTTMYTSLDLCFGSAAAHRAISRIQADINNSNIGPLFTDDDLLLANASIIGWMAQGLPCTTSLTQTDLIAATCPTGKPWVEVARAYILTLHLAGRLELPTFIPRTEGGYWLFHSPIVHTNEPIATRAEATAAVEVLPGIGRITEAQRVELIDRIIPNLSFPSENLFVDPAKRFQALRHLQIT